MPSPIHRYVTAVVFAVMATLTAPAMADQVLMKNGDIITGNINRIEDNEVFIEPSYADEFSDLRDRTRGRQQGGCLVRTRR